jgi:hypothetical protein
MVSQVHSRLTIGYQGALINWRLLKPLYAVSVGVLRGLITDQGVTGYQGRSSCARSAFVIGSCVANVHFPGTNAHSLDQMGRNPFRIQHRFIGCHIEMQVVLVDPSKGPQIGAERRPCPFAGIAVDLASAITLVIARPFMHAVADSRMGWMTATVALPFIGVAYRARNRDVCRDQVITGGGGRVGADSETALARVPRDEADDGGTIVGAGPVPVPLVGSPPGRILGVRMGHAFFPCVLVQFVCLKGGAGHHASRRGCVQVGLDALPQGMPLCA